MFTRRLAWETSAGSSVGTHYAEHPALTTSRGTKMLWFLPEGRRLSPEVWALRHRPLTWMLWLNIPALFIFALIRGDNPANALAQCAILLLPGAVAVMPRFGQNVRSAATSLGLVVGASILVHLAGGSIEAHFQFFVVIAFLTLYQAWLPFLVALAYVVLEHGILGTLDPSAVYNAPNQLRHPWAWALIHGGFVLAASLANLISWRLTEQEALHDGLTGLPNRTSVLEGLQRELSGDTRRHTAVLFIDLDNFKDANDSFGHEFGDALLRGVAHRLLGGLRRGDILSRLGGDEFAIILRRVTDQPEARLAADRILAILQLPITIGTQAIECRASFGLAFTGDQTHTAADLLRNADLAMYQSKREGGNRISEFTPVLHADALQRTEQDLQLRHALDTHQFVLYYQPIFDLADGSLAGTEALIRWQHPTRGLVPPVDFIPSAERLGLIIPIGLWVLREACLQTSQWQRAHLDQPPLKVSVNLSAVQLNDPALLSKVARALSESGLQPAQLCLEVTETALINDLEATLPTLQAIRAMGVQLALDDFGTGYSSLSYLKRIPVTSLKIDRTFVSDLDSDNDSESFHIVQAIITLAHALGITVTAEGAETEDQLAALRRMHSDHCQGFLLGHPMPVDQISSVIAQRGARSLLPSQHHPAEDPSRSLTFGSGA